jgi:hypothetical protein
VARDANILGPSAARPPVFEQVLPNVFQLITPRVGAQLNMVISLSGTATGQTTLLAQLYNIPIDVSSLPNAWL